MSYLVWPARLSPASAHKALAGDGLPGQTIKFYTKNFPAVRYVLTGVGTYIVYNGFHGNWRSLTSCVWKVCY